MASTVKREAAWATLYVQNNPGLLSSDFVVSLCFCLLLAVFVEPQNPKFLKLDFPSSGFRPEGDGDLLPLSLSLSPMESDYGDPNPD